MSYIDVDYYNVLFLMFVLWLVIILVRTTTVRGNKFFFSWIFPEPPLFVKIQEKHQQYT